MMDYESAPLVIIKGPAGTAKTFLSLAVGLELVEQNKFLVCAVGNESEDSATVISKIFL